MIFGSWARLGLGIPAAGATETRHCGPAAESGKPAGDSRDPATHRTLPAVSGVARGTFERVLGPLGGPWRALGPGTGCVHEMYKISLISVSSKKNVSIYQSELDL